MADSTARRQHIANLLKSASIPFEFFDAIDSRGRDPQTLSSLYSISSAIKTIGYPMIGAQVAILLSHFELYKKIDKLGLPWALILEDDILISHPITPILENVALFPSGWDIVKLCYYRNSMALRHYALSARKRLPIAGKYRLGFFTEVMHSTAAYLISRKGAARMIKFLERGFYQPIDHYTGNISTHQLYEIIPKPVEIDLQHGLDSSIAKERSASAACPPPRRLQLRDLLRRVKLFSMAKKLNLMRLEVQKPISHVFYIASHPWLLLCKPPMNP